ncbi:phosphatase PAP2 family protein [Shigella flexneri]
MKEQLAEEKISTISSHWQKETGFAFPSGHTMFAASWALLAVGLLWPRRRTLSIASAGLGNGGHGKGSACCSGCMASAIWVVATLISWRWWRWQRGLRNEFVGH